MALLHSEDFQKLPPNPRERWLALRDLLELRYENEIASEFGMSNHDAQLEYVAVLADAGNELELFTVTYPSAANIEEEFSAFKAQMAATAARLSLQAYDQPELVLSDPVKARLHAEIDRLRAVIGEIDMADSKRAKLLELLNTLDAEVESTRFDYKRFWKNFVVVCGTIAATTGFLAAAPHAKDTIASIVTTLGAQQNAQDNAMNPDALTKDPPIPSLPPPPKLIENDKSQTDQD